MPSGPHDGGRDLLASGRLLYYITHSWKRILKQNFWKLNNWYEFSETWFFPHKLNRITKSQTSVQVEAASPRPLWVSETTTGSLCCHGNPGSGLDPMPEGGLSNCASPFLPQSVRKMISASKCTWGLILIFGQTTSHTKDQFTAHSIGTTSLSFGNTTREE